MPAVSTDYSFNQQVEVFWGFLRRLMNQVVGPVRMTGFAVSKSGSNILVAPGELLSGENYINLAAQQTLGPFVSVANTPTFLKIVTTRDDNLVDIGVSIPGTGQVLEGAHQYRFAGSYLYNPTLNLSTAVSITSTTNATPIVVTTSAPHGLPTGRIVFITGHTTNTAANGYWYIVVLSTTSFYLVNSTGNGVGGATGTIQHVGAVTGTGASGLFTASSGTPWSTNSEQGKLVRLSDANNVLYGPFYVTSNTSTALTFLGAATGATQAINDHFVLLATHDAAGAMTQSLPLFPGLMSHIIHQQNTDTYTTAASFWTTQPTAAQSAPAGLKSPVRVLTTLDLPQVNSGGSVAFNPGPPTILAQPLNLSVVFAAVQARFFWVGTMPHQAYPYIPATFFSWEIHATGTYSGGVFTVSAGHDLLVPATLSSNALQNFVLVDSAGNIYSITASTGPVSSGASFTISVTPGSGQPNPANGTCVIRSNATSYTWTVTPYKTDGTTLDVDNSIRGTTGVDSNGLVLTKYQADTSVLGVGVKCRVTVQAYNAAYSPSYSGGQNAVDGIWGNTNKSSAVNVGSISSVAGIGRATFSWANPGAWDANTMFYAIAVRTDGGTPSFPSNQVYPGTYFNPTIGSYSAVADPGSVINIIVRTVDHSGNVLSSVDGSASAQALGQAFADAILSSGSISFNFNTAAMDASLGGGLNGGTVLQRIFPRNIAITNIELNISTLSGTSPQVKGLVFKTGSPTLNVASSTLFTGTGVVDDSTGLAATLGNSVTIALERVSGAGTVTSAIGYITVYYQELAVLAKSTPV